LKIVLVVVHRPRTKAEDDDENEDEESFLSVAAQLGGHEKLLRIDSTKESIIIMSARERHPGENRGWDPVSPYHRGA